VAGDHYIQAAFMGRWGEPPAKAARERTIAVRMKKPPKTFLTTPENVGKENNLYPAWVEKLWNLYEGDLIRVAGDLDAGALQQGDEAYLLLQVSALKPRKASFLDDLNYYQANHNLPPFTKTNLPIERVNAVQRRTLPYAETWRWRVLCLPRGSGSSSATAACASSATSIGAPGSPGRATVSSSRSARRSGCSGSCTSRSCTAACSGRSTSPTGSR
jgi:hypothetical protein